MAVTTNKTEIHILDSSLNLITRVYVPHPIDKAGNILQYSTELSDYGQCKFRVSTYDTMFTTYGDILTPHHYHIRLVRNGTTIWQGAIIENTRRTKDYIEVVAAEYLWYLSKKLVHRSSTGPNGEVNIYRIFSSGTMAAAVTAIINETIADYQSSNHALASLTLGTVENPNYPPNMIDGNTPPNKLTGAWNFGNGTAAPQLTFDYHTILYILKSFGSYTYADFNVDQNLAFNFKKFLGTDRRGVINLEWGKHGNAVDFNIPRLGQRQVNSLWGVASDTDGAILHANTSDASATTTDGLLEGVAAYVDVKDQATLNARVAAELPMVSKADNAAVSITVNEKAYPLGNFAIGDLVNVVVNHTAVTYKQERRVVGITTVVHNTGRELTTVQTNNILPWVLPS